METTFVIFILIWNVVLSWLFWRTLKANVKILRIMEAVHIEVQVVQDEFKEVRKILGLDTRQ